MLSKEERRELNTRFWTRFNDMMSGVRSSEGRKVNWVNYDSGIKDVFIRMEADEEGCRLCIDIQHKDKEMRELYFETFRTYVNILKDALGELNWEKEHRLPSGFFGSRISAEMTGYSIHNEIDWNPMHRFMKQKCIRLDEIWGTLRDVLE